jgi:hypothetical protein
MGRMESRPYTVHGVPRWDARRGWLVLEKKTRIVDESALEEVRKLPCLACDMSREERIRFIFDNSGKSGTTISHPHHVRSRGSGGDDVPENLMPLCARHHAEIHQVGTIKMASKYSIVRQWLELTGWESK